MSPECTSLGLSKPTAHVAVCCCRQLAIKALNERLSKTNEETSWPGLDEEEDAELGAVTEVASSVSPTGAPNAASASPPASPPDQSSSGTLASS